MENKTAVEWLRQINLNRELDKFDFEQALAIEKQQIKDAWMDGMEGILHEIAAEKYYNEKYYNETYGNKS